MSTPLTRGRLQSTGVFVLTGPHFWPQLLATFETTPVICNKEVIDNSLWQVVLEVIFLNFWYLDVAIKNILRYSELDTFSL